VSSPFSPLPLLLPGLLQNSSQRPARSEHSLGTPSPTLGALLSHFTLFYLNKLSCFTPENTGKAGSRSEPLLALGSCSLCPLTTTVRSHHILNACHRISEHTGLFTLQRGKGPRGRIWHQFHKTMAVPVMTASSVSHASSPRGGSLPGAKCKSSQPGCSALSSSEPQVNRGCTLRSQMPLRSHDLGNPSN
jgi:hypothetical protein